MPVIEDHPPFGLGISARYAGDRGAERPVLEPHDHLHDKHGRMAGIRLQTGLHLPRAPIFSDRRWQAMFGSGAEGAVSMDRFVPVPGEIG